MPCFYVYNALSVYSPGVPPLRTFRKWFGRRIVGEIRAPEGSSLVAGKADDLLSIPVSETSIRLSAADAWEQAVSGHLGLTARVPRPAYEEAR